MNVNFNNSKRVESDVSELHARFLNIRIAHFFGVLRVEDSSKREKLQKIVQITFSSRDVAALLILTSE